MNVHVYEYIYYIHVCMFACASSFCIGILLNLRKQKSLNQPLSLWRISDEVAAKKKQQQTEGKSICCENIKNNKRNSNHNNL